MLKSLSVQRLYFVLAVVLIVGLGDSFSLYGQVHTTKNVTGNWEDASSWIEPGGSNPPAYDGNLTGTAYQIYGDITRNGDLSLVSNGFTVETNSTLTVTGSISWTSGNITLNDNAKLIVYGNVSADKITVNAGAQLIVYGDLTIRSTLAIYGDVIVLNDYNADSYSRIYNDGNLLVNNNFNYSGSWFSTSNQAPVNHQVYVINGTVNGVPGNLPVQNSNVGRLTDLQSYDPSLYTQYVSLVSDAICSAYTLTATATPTTVYSGSYTQLKAEGFTPSSIMLLDEDFESGLNSWTTKTITKSGWWGDYTFDTWISETSVSNYWSTLSNGTKFFVTNINNADLGDELILTSPKINTQGLANLSLDFDQAFYKYNNDHAYLEVSVDNGSTWTLVKGYNSNSSGGGFGFVHTTINLDNYVGFSDLIVRFRDAYGDGFWAIDNVKVTGTPAVQYSWTSSPVGFTSSDQNTTDNPAQTTTYTVTATDLFNSCSKSADVTVNVNPDAEAPVFPDFPNDTTVTADPATCTANVWYNIPVATDNAGGYAGPLTGFDFLGTAPFNGHSYYMSNDLKLSIDAHKNVFDNGGHLATITSQAENDFLSPFAAAKDTDVWFGLTDAAQEGTFRWVTGEYYSATDPASYKNWNAGEPNNSSNNEDWAEMYGTNPSLNGKWNDQFNTDSRYFFLEFDGPRVVGEMQNEGDPTWYPAPAPGSAFSTGIHHMRFTATDGAGNSTVRTFDIIVNSGLNLAFSNPDQLVCANETGVIYTLNQTLDSYVWNVTGGTISSGGGTNDNYVTVDWGAGLNGKVTATGANTGGCSETVSTNVHIIQPVVYTPSPDTTICSGSTAHLRVTLPVDSAMQFDGSSHIRIGNSPDINDYSHAVVNNRTVSFWFKAGAVNTRQVLYEEGGGTTGFSIYIEKDSIYVHGWENHISWTPKPVSALINSNKWYNIAFVYDAGAPDGIYFKGYLDGKYIGGASASAAANGMSNHPGDINIGTSSIIVYPDNSTDGNNPFTGEIDEFKLWNSSLSESEIYSEQYSNTFTSNEIVHYSFNNDNGTTVVDETGGNDGTLNGTVHTTDAPFRPTVSWSPGGGIGETDDVSPASGTKYTYTLTDPLQGCTTTGNIAVTVSQITMTADITDESCVGSANGSIALNPTGGVLPYTYSWTDENGNPVGSAQNLTNVSPGEYTVLATDANGCTATGTYTVNGLSPSSDVQTTEGNNNYWIGHIYDGTANFDPNDYYGYYQTSGLTFGDGFGGNDNCFVFNNDLGIGKAAIETSTFTVKYLTHLTGMEGIYLVDINSDDGARLTVDGNKVYDEWIDRGNTEDAGILFNLSGNSHLELDYYENGGVNLIGFNNLVQVPNDITSSISQEVCANTAPAAITATDVWGSATSPLYNKAGYSVSYQWQESTDGTIFSTIPGATAKDYTPLTNTSGTRYYHRILTVTHTNPGGIAIAATSTSGVAQITVNPEVGIPAFSDGTTSTRCQGTGTVTYSATAANATVITYSLDNTSLTYGNSIDASTGAVTYVSGWSGTSTITVTAEGCGGPQTATHTVTTTASVGVPTPITVSAGSEPACPPETTTLTTTYSSTATNNTGLVWSIDNPSAGSINSSTGVMTWAQGFSGTVKIKVEASGCNGPTMTSRTVTVEDNEPPAFDSAFTYGDLSECPDNVSLNNVQQGTLILDLPVNNTDNCSSMTSLYFSVSGATTVAKADVSGRPATDPIVFNQGTSTVTYYLDDGNGNENTITFEVTILHKPELGDIN